MSDTPTTFEELWDSFKNKVTAYEFLNYSDEEEEYVMNNRLKDALREIQANSLGIKADYDIQEFNKELNEDEFLAIVYWLIFEWITPKVNTEDLIEQKYNISQFKGTSQGNHLKELKSLQNYMLSQAVYYTGRINSNAKYILGL